MTMTDTSEPLYAWQVFENGEWNIIAAVLPEVSDQPIALVSTRRRVCDWMEPIALAHGRSSGLPVRLAHYTDPIVVAAS